VRLSDPEFEEDHRPMLLSILLVFLIIVCVALVGVILLQQSEGGALGMGGGPQGFITTRGAGDLLTRTTWILTAIFFSLCLALTFLSGHAKNGSSVVDRLKIDPTSPDFAQPKPVAPAAKTPAGAPPTIEAPKPEVHTAQPGAPAPAANDPFGGLEKSGQKPKAGNTAK
jgi:preprotein translocase subunit SecG